MRIPERLETKRLILRPIHEEKFSEFLDFYKIADPGFSLVILNKIDDEILGICGLTPIKDSRNVECVYALLPEFRSYGFAIEAMLKLIEYAFIRIDIPKIIAHIKPDNTHGWKVAERIGMKYMGQIQLNGPTSKAMVFIISKDEYIGQHSY
jgi:RimJ/RimL family protein N-acetyltransferase